MFEIDPFPPPLPTLDGNGVPFPDASSSVSAAASRPPARGAASKRKPSLPAFPIPDPFDRPSTPEELAPVRALLEQFQKASVPQRRQLDQRERGELVHGAVHEGRIGARVVGRLMASMLGPELAREFGEELVERFFVEHGPRTAAERALVEHLALVHAQGLVCRTRWASATQLADLEALTRIQSRLTNEFNRLLDALAAQRDGRRVTIANANIAQNQVVQQFNGTNEMGAGDAGL